VAENLGSVLLSLGVDLDDFNSGLQQAQKLATTAGKSISDRLDVRRATLSGLQQQLTALEAKLKTNPWSAAALEAPIKALQSEIALRKQSIALLEKQINTTNSFRAREALNSGAGAEFAQGAIGGIPLIGNLAGAGPAIIGAGVAAAGVAAVKTSNDFQKLNQQLTLLTGSASTTEKVLRELKDYAAKTPFDLPGVAENAKLLLAYGLNTEQAVEFTKRLGDVATVTGTPLDRLALNFGQIVSQGKAYTVDLKQFSLAGVPIFESLSKVTGKSVEDLKALGTAIPADQVVAAFRQMTDSGGKFYQGGEKGGTVLDATFANLQDSAKELGVIIGNSLQPSVLDGIQAAAGAINATVDAVRALQGLKSIPVFSDIALFFQQISATPALRILSQFIGATSNELKYTFGGKPSPTSRDINQEVQEEAKRRREAFDKAQAAKKEQQKKEQQKIVDAVSKERAIGQESIAQAQQQYEETSKLANLKGDVRDIAAQQLRIDQALAAEAKAYVDAYNAQQGKDPVNAQKLQDAATVSSILLRAAMVDGAKLIREAAENAEQRFKSAGESIKSALAAQDSARVAAFDVITQQAQQETRSRLIGRVQEGVNAGQLDPNKIRQVYGPDLGTLDINRLADLAGKSASLIDAQDGVINASNELKSATENLTGVNKLLADKDWMVRVNVASDGQAAVSGAILGG
jgi:hypothetical protein